MRPGSINSQLIEGNIRRGKKREEKGPLRSAEKRFLKSADEAGGALPAIWGGGETTGGGIRFGKDSNFADGCGLSQTRKTK